MDTVQLLCEISVLKQKMDKAEAFLEELVEYLLVTCKDDDYITPEVICRKLAKYGYIELENGYWVNPLKSNADNAFQSVESVKDETGRWVRVGQWEWEHHTDTTHFGKAKGESITTDKIEDEPQTSGTPYKIETSSVCKDEPQTERSSE